MKVVTVRDFRDRATEMLRSEDVILVTRGGKPAGFYIPWDRSDVPLELKRELFAQLADRTRADLVAAGVTEEEVLADFAAWRATRRPGR